MTLQAQTRGGIVSLLVCDYKNGELRGYVQFDAERLGAARQEPVAVSRCSTRAIWRSPSISRPRRSAIRASCRSTANSLGAAAESYFLQSEQIPSLVRLGVRRDAAGKLIAGGIFLQHLPEGEEGRERLHTRLDHPEWQHVEALGSTMGADELADAAIPLENARLAAVQRGARGAAAGRRRSSRAAAAATLRTSRRCSASSRPKNARRWPTKKA